MRRLFSGILMVTLAVVSYGQSVSSQDALGRILLKESPGSATITMDSLVLEHYKKHLVSNSKNRGIEGFRIRIFSDNGQGAKEDQMRVRAGFLSLFPDMPAYYRYEGSYYKIYVGDFRTRRDAMKMLNIIKKEFPDAFIVEDKIVLPE